MSIPLGPLALAAMQYQTGQNEGQVQANMLENQREIQQANLARQLAMEQMMAGYRQAQESHLGDLGEYYKARESDRAAAEADKRARDAWQQGVAERLATRQENNERALEGYRRDVVGIRQLLADKVRDWSDPSERPAGRAGARQAELNRRYAFYTSPRKDPTDPLGMRVVALDPVSAMDRAQQDVDLLYGPDSPAAPRNRGGVAGALRTLEGGTRALGAFGELAPAATAGPAADASDTGDGVPMSAVPAGPLPTAPANSFSTFVNQGTGGAQAGGAQAAYNAARAAGADPATAYRQAIAPPGSPSYAPAGPTAP